MASPGNAKDEKDALIGKTIARRYQVEARIGHGGMGYVYRAQQLDMNRKVALKVLHPQLTDNDEIKKRFHREMRATTRIEHPNSVRVYEYGEHEGLLYLAMELCEGRSLDQAVEDEAPFAPVRTAVIAMQIAQALAAAEKEKIVHRDLKPENVMLVDRYGQPDVVKVLDFGLARIGEDDGESTDAGRLTQAGVRVGTPTYMAPEYIQLFTFDHRSDLYSLGVLMYLMTTGRVPFTGRPFEILEQAVLKAPVPPSQLAPDTTPVWLEKIILKLLAKKPDDRIQTATEVFHALDRGRTEAISAPAQDVTVVQQGIAAAQAPAPSAPAKAGGALAKARRISDQATQPIPGKRESAPKKLGVGDQLRDNAGVIVAGCGLVALVAAACLVALAVVAVLATK